MAKPFEVANMSKDEIMFLTKPIATYNNTLVDATKLKHHMALCHMPTIANSSFNKTNVDCGMLARLPIELFENILKYADMSSAMHIRATNSTFKQLVELWPPFAIAIKDARATVAAMVATESSKLWSFVDLTSLIYTSACHLCGQYGEVLHLLKLKRVCFKCVTSDRRLLAVYEPYILQDMALSTEEIKTLPHLSMVPQNRFWNLPCKRQNIYDYSAALDLAMDKYNTEFRPIIKTPEPRCMVRVPMAKTKLSVDPKMRSSPRSKIRKPVYMRRKSYLKSTLSRISNLPSFLVNPPESSYAQHACCTYFPALTPPTAQKSATKISALLCAGCSFYFNYHTHLPHQTHTLYPYDTTNITAKSPLTDHLQSCFYARLFWDNLYQPHMNYHDASNPHLTANGGTRTVQHMATDVQVRRAILLNPREFRHRHFPRHPFTDDTATTGTTPAENNRRFEMISSRFLTVGARLRKTPPKTGLEVELETKLKDRNDAWIADVMDPERDGRFDTWTRDKIDRIRARELEDGNAKLHEDQYADVFLGALETVSQASWATMRASSANCLFRGWTGLLRERAEKEMLAHARANGRGAPVRTIDVEDGRGWGLDRLGCVSFLG